MCSCPSRSLILGHSVTAALPHLPQPAKGAGHLPGCGDLPLAEARLCEPPAIAVVLP